MTDDTFFWVMLVLLPIIFYSLVVKRRRERERAKAAAEAADPADAPAVIARFKKIRSLCAWLSFLPIVLGMASMIMLAGRGGNCGSSSALAGEFLGVPYYRWILVGFGLVVFGAVFGMIVFRCPVCKTMPMSNDGWLDDRGVLLNPDFCPSCKTRLR
jgi:hypothetical protein